MSRDRRSSGRPLGIAGETVAPGARRRVDLPIGRLASGTWLEMPLEVLCGDREGPTIWLSGAIHGDEVIGVEIVRQVLDRLEPAALAGQIIAAPIVNVFGFVIESRYLPDRRDLNRSFPGSARGSLASRTARLFMDEVVARCDLGIDLHAGSDDRTNLPQVRCDLDDRQTRRLARAFAAPVTIHSRPRAGTLRAAALRAGKRVLLFEGGEPRRFSPEAVATGVPGILRVLAELEMIDGVPAAEGATLESRQTTWARAPRGGIVRLEVGLGERVERNALLASIGDPLGDHPEPVRAPIAGVVVGLTVNPLTAQGDALVHLAAPGKD